MVLLKPTGETITRQGGTVMQLAKNFERFCTGEGKDLDVFDDVFFTELRVVRTATETSKVAGSPGTLTEVRAAAAKLIGDDADLCCAWCPEEAEIPSPQWRGGQPPATQEGRLESAGMVPRSRSSTSTRLRSP